MKTYLADSSSPLLERGWHRGVLLGWRRQWQQAGILAPPHSHTHLLFLVRDGNVQIILEIAVPKLLLCVALMCLFFWIHGCYIFLQFSLHSLCGFPKKSELCAAFEYWLNPQRQTPKFLLQEFFLSPTWYEKLSTIYVMTFLFQFFGLFCILTLLHFAVHEDSCRYRTGF